jgi:hypothetical protein
VKTQNKAYQQMDETIRSQNDPDGTVASSGEGSGGSEV